MFGVYVLHVRPSSRSPPRESRAQTYLRERPVPLLIVVMLYVQIGEYVISEFEDPH